MLADELLTKLRLMKILCVLESFDELRSVLGDMAVNRASNILKHPSKFFAAMNITEDNLGNVMRGCFEAEFQNELIELLGKLRRVINEIHHISNHGIIYSNELASDFIVLALEQRDKIEFNVKPARVISNMKKIWERFTRGGRDFFVH